MTASAQTMNFDRFLVRKVRENTNLEVYCFALQTSLSEDLVLEKLGSGDKASIEKALRCALDWLDNSPAADSDVLLIKQKELADFVNPLLFSAGLDAVAIDATFRVCRASCGLGLSQTD